MSTTAQNRSPVDEEMMMLTEADGASRVRFAEEGAARSKRKRDEVPQEAASNAKMSISDAEEDEDNEDVVVLPKRVRTNDGDSIS